MAVKRVYEAMFLFDPAVGTNWQRVEEQVKRLVDRAEGELIKMKKWDERRLTYEIAKRKRGVYVLAYFHAPTDKIGPMERDVQLSDEIIRALILCKHHISDEKAIEIVDKAEAYVPAPHEGYYDRGDRDRGDRFAPRRDYRDRDRAVEEIPEIPEIAELEEGGDEIPANP